MPLPRTRDNQVRHVPLRWVEDAEHYDVIVEALSRASISLWIATANLKDVRLEAPIGSAARARRRYVSIAERFEEVRARGVELRVLHGGSPSAPFREALAKRARLRPAQAWLRQPRNWEWRVKRSWPLAIIITIWKCCFLRAWVW